MKSVDPTSNAEVIRRL